MDPIWAIENGPRNEVDVYFLIGNADIPASDDSLPHTKKTQ